jgi:alpha/beta superfamily hydrolase
MPNAMSRPITEPIIIPGPAGDLEGIAETPGHASVASVGVVCHPHPLYGGAMTNKVAHVLAKAFNERGAAAVRFNFRGVGASAGAHDEGEGETDDAIAALDWAARRWPGAGLWLAGFSFGGAIAILAAVKRKVERLITVAPAIRRVSVAGPMPRIPWLVVQGDRDELVDPDEIKRWAESLEPRPELKLLQGVDHFFHGRLNELRDVVTTWLAAGRSGSGAE